MIFKKICLCLLVVSGLSASNFAQDLKIGYVNIELAMLYMPETKTMNQQLQTYQQKLGEKLQVKQQYAQTKLQEYQEMKQTNLQSAATLEAKEKELIKLDEEIRKEASEADQKLLEKRQKSMEPLVERLQNTLKSLADEEGYDFILNSVDGNGVSIVLHGPPEHDLTEKLMKKLGIEIPSNN